MSPWHWNLPYAGTIQPWNSSDTEQSYNRMMQDPQHRRYFAEQGYDKITYRFNSDGFRGDEFTTGGIVALGCSFTFGVGLLEETVWPYIVGQELALPVANLSWGGNSLDGCFRMAEYWIPKLKPVLVVMLAPAPHRHDLITERDVITFVPEEQHQHSQDYYIKTWTANEENSRLNNQKNKLAIGQICALNTTQLIIYEAMREMSRSREEIGYARDYMHAGTKGHRMLADKIIREYRG